MKITITTPPPIPQPKTITMEVSQDDFKIMFDLLTLPPVQYKEFSGEALSFQNGHWFEMKKALDKVKNLF